MSAGKAAVALAAIAGAVFVGGVVWLVVAYLTAVLTVLPWAVAFETAVTVSALCDWREAQLKGTSARSWWVMAHGTVWVRIAARLGWVGRLLRVAYAQGRKAGRLWSWRREVRKWTGADGPARLTATPDVVTEPVDETVGAAS